MEMLHSACQTSRGLILLACFSFLYLNKVLVSDHTQSVKMYGLPTRIPVEDLESNYFTSFHSLKNGHLFMAFECMTARSLSG